MNGALVSRVLDFLARHGVREIATAAGARNSPLIEAFSRLDAFRIHPFFEERSAAFFALGRIQAERAPVAVVTTSGTAVAELLPAMIEAHYSGLPLLALTADRPARYRGTGAPQAIEQVGIFSCYAVASDWPEGDDPDWDHDRPCHLNLAFEEPLPGIDPASLHPPRVCRQCQPAATSTIPLSRASAVLDDFLASVSRPVALVGALDAAEREGVIDFLLRLNAPVYAEPLSGLREDPRLRELCLRSGERAAALGRDGVLRLGAVPVAGLWRDLDRRLPGLKALSISALPFPGSARVPLLPISPAELTPSRSFDCDLADDFARARRLEALFESEPTSEPAMFHLFSRRLEEGTSVYLGNSLPIREWDLAATRDRRFEAMASRGANGIDGQLSTFYGICASRPRTWGILGDLTTLYDLAAPWILSHLPHPGGRLVVVNNRGGKIFTRMFKDPAFQNRHALGFSSWAEMWGLPHERWERIPERLPGADTPRVIEWLPDEAATERFWKEYDRLWT